MAPVYADIIIDISHEAIDRPFQYRIPEQLINDVQLGTMVRIPFGKGNRLRTGYVIGRSGVPKFAPEKTKEIDSVCNGSVPATGRLLALAAWIREHYGSTMIEAIRTVLPVKQTVRRVVNQTVALKISEREFADARSGYENRRAQAKLRLLDALASKSELPMQTVKHTLRISPQTLRSMEQDGVIRITSEERYRQAADYQPIPTFEIRLNEEQQAVVDTVVWDLKEDRHPTYLLHGVTGSGKTEVYVHIVKQVVSMGRQAIVLIPEIALTYQTVRYFRNYFGDRVTILNSRLSDGERYDQFLRAENGDVDVVIGPRSALFTPFPNLGLIILDEEHETSYKSDYPPKYHAREVAVKRAELEHASVLLGSATPSVESYHKACTGTYRLLELKHRAGNGRMAETKIVDLRAELRAGNRSVISRELAAEMADRLEKKQQILLFINKRGYNSFVSCRDCGEAIKCPHCDVSLTRHENHMLICHYCGYEILQPNVCPTCHSKLIGGYGTGTQKVEAEVKRLFPDARILRMDKDTTTEKHAHEQILSRFGNGEADILVGTQMIVKGHDFPNVTLVGILLADLTLFEHDYRAGERTFDLITQAAGRAGRGELSGKVILQTYQPEHYAIRAAAAQDYAYFYREESAYRKMMKYPPEWNMLVLLLTSSDEEYLKQKSETIGERIKTFVETCDGMELIGPTVPVISKLRDVYRRVVYIKHSGYNELAKLADDLTAYLASREEHSDLSLQCDFNPLSIY